MYDSLFIDKAYALDITDYKERGVELAKAIAQAVKDTQAVVIRALPDRIIMTGKQYADLSKQPEMQQMYNQYGEVVQDFYLYRTDLNIMEVEVKK